MDWEYGFLGFFFSGIWWQMIFEKSSHMPKIRQKTWRRVLIAFFLKIVIAHCAFCQPLRALQGTCQTQLSGRKKTCPTEIIIDPSRRKTSHCKAKIDRKAWEYKVYNNGST